MVFFFGGGEDMLTPSRLFGDMVGFPPPGSASALLPYFVLQHAYAYSLLFSTYCFPFPIVSVSRLSSPVCGCLSVPIHASPSLRLPSSYHHSLSPCHDLFISVFIALEASLGITSASAIDPLGWDGKGGLPSKQQGNVASRAAGRCPSY